MYDLKRLAFKLVAHPQSNPEPRGEGLRGYLFCNLGYGRVTNIRLDRCRVTRALGRGYWWVAEQRLTHLFFGQFFAHVNSRSLIAKDGEILPVRPDELVLVIGLCVQNKVP